MISSTPFFPAFRAYWTPVSRKLVDLQQATVSQLESVFATLIPPELLSQTSSGQNSREHIYSLRVTFWAFLSQALCPGSSCRETVRKVQAAFHQQGGRSIDEGTGAYCIARSRLPMPLLERVQMQVIQRMQQNTPANALWLGRDVKILDGTTLSMPDTPDNQATYPQPSSQKPGCGFPMVRLAALFSLANGALLQAVKSSLHVHESRLARQLWPLLQKGDLILGDRAYCSFTLIAELLEKGVDCVLRLHQRRPADLRKGKKLGAQDRLIRWKKPILKPTFMSAKEFNALPTELTVRLVKILVQAPGFRTRQIILVTTLLDPEAYSLQALADLYLRRWRIELSFRELKTFLQLEVLRCLTPRMIEKEMLVHLIAYNLIRYLMLQASLTYDTPLLRISFKGTVDSLRHWSGLIHRAKGPKRNALITHLFRIIAADQLPHRPNRREPRCVKRRPKPSQYLTRPRHLMREIPHRNKYRKPQPSTLI